jgi:hypothetical protein
VRSFCDVRSFSLVRSFCVRSVWDVRSFSLVRSFCDVRSFSVGLEPF